jgi:hypothetical protein
MPIFQKRKNLRTNVTLISRSNDLTFDHTVSHTLHHIFVELVVS